MRVSSTSTSAQQSRVLRPSQPNQPSQAGARSYPLLPACCTLRGCKCAEVAPALYCTCRQCPSSLRRRMSTRPLDVWAHLPALTVALEKLLRMLAKAGARPSIYLLTPSPSLRCSRIVLTVYLISIGADCAPPHRTRRPSSRHTHATPRFSLTAPSHRCPTAARSRCPSGRGHDTAGI